ncbi:MAG TPA: alpha-L-rhamnosidase N-terminal domain-containing protein, partial [Clostridia bacterium]|nr:alpha-L-rhamnosidase N-terminal domain-containing protein [Clostridia bacterium]
MKTCILRKIIPGIALAMTGWCLGLSNGFAASGFGATDLRCEYGRNPNAVGTAKPRLSWVVGAGKTDRGVIQAAYQVLVASSPELLKKNQGDLWDSGKVYSDQSIQVPYAGRELSSGQACYWKVKLWDEAGKATDWSTPAQWTTGLLKPSDWQAKWIGYDASSGTEDATSAAFKKQLKLDESKWVWVGGAKAGDQPAGKAYFRKVIQIPAGRTLKQATFLLAADDAFQLFINGHSSGQGNSWKNASSPDVTGRLQPGANAIGIEVTNGGENPTPAGLIGRLVMAFVDGEITVVPIDGTWQTSREAGDRWNLADFNTSAWKAAAEIASFGNQPWGKVEAQIVSMEPAPYFRKAFRIQKPVKRATAFSSALGVYELHLNGKAVDNDVLSPGWTDYHKRVHYFGYDITKQIKRGENVVGAILGDGWYAGYLAFTGRRHYYGDQTRLIVQMEIEYQDGSKEVIGTDESWKATTGAIREGDMLMGCTYDARKEIPGWDTSRCDDGSWRNAIVDNAIKATLEAHPGAPIRRIEEVRARKVTEPKPGV